MSSSESSPDSSLHGRVVVVGAGITGLVAGWRLGRLEPGRPHLVLEAASRAGGVLGATEVDGWRIDRAANGFLTNAPATLELARDLGLEVVPAAPAATRRYLYRSGGLRPLPTSPPAFVTSELLSPAGKARALLEPLVGRGDGREESVHAFLARRFGRRAADALAEALVLGITAGDPRALSLDALFPRLRRLEREHGSLLRGMVAAQQAARRARSGAPNGDDRGARGRLATIAGGGLTRLVEALAEALGERLRTGAAAAALERRRDGWRVRLADGTAVDAESLVLATPAPVAADLLRPHAPAAAAALTAIPYAPVRVLGLGFDRIDVPHPLDGFGFLAPAGEGVRSLGTLWSSALFEGRAPAGKVLLRVIAGGARDPGFVDLPDDAALASVRDDLRVAMGIVAEPERTWGVRWPRGIPQYLLGHAERVAIAERETRPLGLVLAGNAYRGVGVNDCVRDGERAARALVGRRDAPPAPNPDPAPSEVSR